jgi:hypothetical protein
VSDSINTIAFGFGIESGQLFTIAENSTAFVVPGDVVISDTIIQAYDSEEITSENIAVTALADGSTITHHLNTQELAVTFYENNVLRKDISYEINSNSTIIAYLPTPDGTTYSFTGDVYFEKRNATL